MRVSSVAAECLKDGTDLVRHPDIAATASRTFTIDSVDVRPRDVVRDLWVLLDSELILISTRKPDRQYVLLPPAQAQAAETSRRSYEAAN